MITTPPVQHGSKVWPMLILGLVIGAVIGTGGNWWWQQMHPKTTTNTTTKTSITPTATVLPKSSTTGTNGTDPTTPVTDLTADWKTYADPTHNVSFKYPTTWPALRASTTMSDDPYVPSNMDIFCAENVGQNCDKYVYLSTFDSYQKFGSAFNEEINQLVAVFNNKNSVNTQSFWLPKWDNVTLTYYTKPQYIENSARTYRGVYYYAGMTQNESTPRQLNGANVLGSFVLVLTDGKSKIVQLEKDDSTDWGLNPENPNTPRYHAIDKCIDQAGNTTNCVVDKQLLTDFTNEYQPFATNVK